MRKLLGLFVLLVALIAVGSSSAQTTTTTAPKTITNAMGVSGGSSSWMTNLTLPRMRLTDLFSPFNIMSTPGTTSSTFISPTDDPGSYLKQFGYSRPGRR